MKFREPICPSCGKGSETGEICASCRVGKTVWLECKKRVDCIRCPACGARKTGSTWTDDLEEIEKDALAEEMVKSAIRLHPIFRNPVFYHEDQGDRDEPIRRGRVGKRNIVRCAGRGSLPGGDCLDQGAMRPVQSHQRKLLRRCRPGESAGEATWTRGDQAGG